MILLKWNDNHGIFSVCHGTDKRLETPFCDFTPHYTRFHPCWWWKQWLYNKCSIYVKVSRRKAWFVFFFFLQWLALVLLLLLNTKIEYLQRKLFSNRVEEIFPFDNYNREVGFIVLYNRVWRVFIASKLIQYVNTLCLILADYLLISGFTLHAHFIASQNLFNIAKLANYPLLWTLLNILEYSLRTSSLLQRNFINFLFTWVLKAH